MKKYLGFLLSSTLLLSLVSFNTASALTTSDISMLRAAGIITEAQATSLSASLNTTVAPVSLPVQATAIAKQVSAIATKCSAINTDLSYNLNGDGVSALQDFLSSSGYLTATSRGYFGGLTVSAVKAFQTANGINPTGYVGPLTRAKIQNLCNGIVTNPTGTIEQVKKTIQNAVTPEVQNAIQKQVQNINSAGAIPSDVSSLIKSVGSQIPKIDCSNFTAVPSCSYLPDVLQAQCKVCKGQ